MNKKEIIYLAIPYTHDDTDVVDFRADVSDIIVADLANRGFNVFAPISAWHKISKKHNLPGDWDFWQNYDEAFIKISGTLLIIMLEGWRYSVGVTAETALADKYRLKVDFIDPRQYVAQLRKEGNYNNIMYDVYGRTEEQINIRKRSN